MRKTKYIKDVMGNCGYNMDSNITLINLDSDGYIYFIDNNTNTYYKAIYTSSTPIMIDSDTSTLTFDGSKYLAGVSAYTFTYVVTNEDNIDVTGEITFSSNDENIVTVTNNVITAVGSGTTTISLVHEDYDPITDPGASGLSYITVGPYVDALLHDTIYLLSGETFYATGWTNSLGQTIPVSQLAPSAGEGSLWTYDDTYLTWADTEGGFTALNLTGSTTITATDPITEIEGVALVMITDPLSITTASPLEPGILNNEYIMDNFAAAGGASESYSWSLSSGSLPNGLSLSPNGGLSGTPITNTGTSTFTIEVVDYIGTAATKEFTLDIYSEVEITSSSALCCFVVDEPNIVQLEATGGRGVYVWTVTDGTLLRGLTLSSGGEISGTPTRSGTLAITISATDNITTDEKEFLIEVTEIPFSITTDGDLGTVNFGELMTPIQLTTEGETGTVTFAVHMGDTIPSGLTLSSTGLISGTPAVSGNTSFTIIATDDLGSCEKQFTLFIAKVVSSVVDLVAVGDNMNYVTIDNSLHTITFAAAAGTLPINTFYSIILTDDGGLGSIEYLDTEGDVLTGTDTINSVISLFVTAEDGVTTRSYLPPLI